MLRVREGGERIPITIADYDREAGTLTIVVQEVGATTKRVCALEAGDEILDVAGPMGGHIDIAPGGHVCGVGGGFGSAALLCLMREFTARGDRTTAILGARSEDLIILADVVHCGDAGMPQLGDGLSFTPEPRCGRSSIDSGAQDLQGNVASQRNRMSFVDNAHSATPKSLLDLEVADSDPLLQVFSHLLDLSGGERSIAVSGEDHLHGNPAGPS